METCTEQLRLAFQSAVSRYHMLGSDTGILVGYSGGADSAALLSLLHGMCTERGIYLAAMHVHHGIRGAEADRDAAFCAAECERLGVDFLLRRADIPAMARESGRGLEETARDFRYHVFAETIASDARLSCAATAHHADDNAETVLMNLMRGTGIDGLCGIPPVRESEGMRIIRPLIFAPKQVILGYCRENGINYISDSTNTDTAYTRNYIRSELLPGMTMKNPSFAAAVSRMTETLREDRAYLDAEAARFAETCSRGPEIDAGMLAGAPRPIASRTAAMVYARVSAGTLETVHIDAILRLVRMHREGAALSLPDRVRAVIGDGRLRFTREPDTVPPVYEMPLHEGINRPEGQDFALLVRKSGASDADFQKDKEYLKNIYKLSIHTRVNSDRIDYMPGVRSRRDGDAYVFGGMTRKLKKLYNDRGLSAAERRQLPVIFDGDGIIWVPGFPPADRVRSGNAADGVGTVLDIDYYYN